MVLRVAHVTQALQPWPDLSIYLFTTCTANPVRWLSITRLWKEMWTVTSMRSNLKALLLILVCCMLVGCGGRKPPTVIEVRLLETPGRVLYNGEEMGQAEAERELQYVATERRNEITNTATNVRIVIISPNGANSRRAREFSQYCQSIGLNGVQYQVR